MATRLRFRRDPAATWTSVNPILSIGEIGAETDTGKIKIGNGATAWNSLVYAGTTGPAQTNAVRNLGDGSDGNVTISSGTTTLSRDMYYNNLTMSGTGILSINGYKVFVKGILDLSAAGAAAIQWNGNNGNNASASTGGAAQTTQPGATLGDIMAGNTGANGPTGTGVNGTNVAAITGNGGVGGAGGRGGSGGSGNPAAARAAKQPINTNPVRTFKTQLLYGVLLVSGGTGGNEGSSGSGDGVNSGGGSGSGGNGGGTVAIYANIVVKSSVTPSGVIQAKGGNGGNGGTPTTGNCGGGGAGSGGGGGWIYFCYNYKFGPTIANFFDTQGGQGGTGGTATGTGTGGNGGDAGSGGRITVLNIPSKSSVFFIGNSNTALDAGLLQTTAFNVMTSGGGPGINGFSRLDF